MLFEILVYPIPFAILFGLGNYVYFRKQGYRSYGLLYMSIVVFYALGVMLTQFFFGK